MVTLKEILETVSLVCKISVTNLRSKKRYRIFSEARGLYFLFARDFTNCGVQEISKYVNRHHATCIHYSKITPQLLKYDKKYRITYGEIESKLNKIASESKDENEDMLKQINIQIAQLLKKKERIVSAKENT